MQEIRWEEEFDCIVGGPTIPVEMQFQCLNNPPFDNDDARQELIRQLNCSQWVFNSGGCDQTLAEIRRVALGLGI
jgi:hypothetical protein